MTKLKKWKIVIPATLLVFSILLNIAGRVWHSFSEYYVNNIFHIWVETYGRISGIFPFSIGEWLLYLAFILVMLFLFAGIAILVFRKQISVKLKSHYRSYSIFLFWVLGIVSVIMTCNCFLLYQCPPFSERFPMGNPREYSTEELAKLRDYVVEQANILAPAFERDQKGNIIYNNDVKQEARNQMKLLGEKYHNLSGYYPNPKAFSASKFFCQQSIMGYYFPFTMEANYNDKMYITNIPASLCHELSHLKGFIFEDEANFIGYLACVDAKDPMFRYSAYLSVIGYLDHDFVVSLGESAATEYYKHPIVDERVIYDTIFLTEEVETEVEESAILDTEMVEKASNTFINTTLTLNGVEDGMASYSRVVELLLQYYDGILY